MQNLSQTELQFFSKIQGACVLMAGLLLIITRLFIDARASLFVQCSYVFTFTSFLVLYVGAIYFEKRLTRDSTQFIIGLYSAISIFLLLLFIL